MSSSLDRVNNIDVGTPPYPQEWETFRFHFHNFKAKMQKNRGDGIESQKFDCCGTKWYVDIRVMPNLNDDSSDSDESDNDNDDDSDDISISLWKVDRSISINLDYKAIIKDLDGGYVLNQERCSQFELGHHGRNIMWKQPPIKLSYLIDPSNNILVDGTLTIELSMKLHTPNPSTRPCKQFIPTNPINNLMPSMFNNEETADVLFEVSPEEESSDISTRKSKKAKVSPVRFYAHRCILKLCAPQLADLCESSGDKLSPIPISNVKPNIFHHLLHYTYGGKITINEFKQHAKDIINASDMYGITNLKLEAEVWYNKCLTLSPENVMEELHYAESKNLALLKEMVMDYLVENSTQIINKVSLDNAPESSSLIRDMLTAISMRRNDNNTIAESSASSTDDDTNHQKYRTMRVSALRRNLHDRGLGVDGSREVLVAALEKSEQVEDENGKVSAE